MTAGPRGDGALPPPDGTLQRWAWEYVTSDDLGLKMAPPPAPAGVESDAPARRLAAPGRPGTLTVIERAPKAPRPGALVEGHKRAQIFHTFWHHELQAAELMAWALLAFPEAPGPLQRGLVRVLEDEVRHMALYRRQLQRLDLDVGAFGVRDWFWQRVPTVRSLPEFLAVMGLGLEAANLDHAPRFAARLRAVGDLDGASTQEQVAEEEIPHSALALRWFVRLTGADDASLFARWSDALPPPLSPLLMRGLPLDRDRRGRAGFGREFLDALEQWQPSKDPPTRGAEASPGERPLAGERLAAEGTSPRP